MRENEEWGWVAGQAGRFQKQVEASHLQAAAKICVRALRVRDSTIICIQCV